MVQVFSQYYLIEPFEASSIEILQTEHLSLFS